MPLNLWRRWSAQPARTAAKTIAAGRRYRPFVEVLEHRCLPSLVTVTSASDDPSDSGSLRYALNNAAPGETIDFAPNVRTIDLSSKLNTTGLTIPVALSIINDQGIGPVTIDGGGVLTVFTVGNVTALLSGLTITDGTEISSPTYIGGNILNTGTLTINNCTVSNSSVGNYGPGAGVQNYGTVTINNSTFSTDSYSAILNTAGMATVSGSSFSNNNANVAAIQNYATVQFNDCNFSDNSTTGEPGGAIYNAGALWVSNSTFSNNTASGSQNYGYGGGICNSGALVVSDSIFVSNSALSSRDGPGGGGAIYNEGGTLTISGSTFSNNSAGAGGGGAICSPNGVLTVNNCTFCYNSVSAGGDGGAISSGGTLTVLNSSVSINTASGSGENGLGEDAGGGIYTSNNPSFVVTLDGDIVAGNVNTFAGTVPDDIGGVVGLTSSDNLIGTGGSGGLLDAVNGNQVGASIADVGLAPLADNGGPTPTMAIGLGSLAIGRGYTETIATTDQRGVARPIGQPSDVGAFQYSVSPAITADPTRQTIIAGQSASFSAAASAGIPTPTAVQWQASTDGGNSFTSLSNNGPYSGVSSTTLTITSAPAALTGDQYRAVFTNSAGLSAITTSAALTVEDPTSITVAGGSPQNTIIGTSFSTALQARVLDTLGDPIAGIPVTFVVPAAGPTGTFGALATVLSDGLGIATAPTLTANHIQGTFTVTATAEGVASPATFTLTNTAAPSSIKVGPGSSQRAIVNTMYKVPLQARVTDTHGKPVAGISVVFELPNGPSGTFAGSAAAVTNANGIATASALIANTQAGTFSVNAWVAGVSTPASFTLTNIPAGPAAVNAIAGTPQTAAPGKPFATKLQAQVLDRYGNPVSGVAVTFSTPTSGASGTFAGRHTTVAVTGADGIAAVAITANAISGSFTVTAALSAPINGVAPAIFQLDNVAPVGPHAVSKRSRAIGAFPFEYLTDL
jgi:hypothetical protein